MDARNHGQPAGPGPAADAEPARAGNYDFAVIDAIYSALIGLVSEPVGCRELDGGEGDAVQRAGVREVADDVRDPGTGAGGGGGGDGGVEPGGGAVRVTRRRFSWFRRSWRP
jgi:hypothetical protein